MRPKWSFSHGLESGPHATKVSALAEVATAMGWREVRPDYRDLDASRDVTRIDQRIARALAAVRPDAGPVVFAGSSMGAFTSGFASLQQPCIGLFLMAPPLRIPGYARIRARSAGAHHHRPCLGRRAHSLGRGGRLRAGAPRAPSWSTTTIASAGTSPRWRAGSAIS